MNENIRQVYQFIEDFMRADPRISRVVSPLSYARPARTPKRYLWARNLQACKRR